jgi:hypothetical protein
MRAGGCEVPGDGTRAASAHTELPPLLSLPLRRRGGSGTPQQQRRGMHSASKLNTVDLDQLLQRHSGLAAEVQVRRGAEGRLQVAVARLGRVRRTGILRAP